MALVLGLSEAGVFYIGYRGTMQTFSILITSLGVLTAFIYYFSCWTAFGTFYMLSTFLVVVVAFFKRSHS